MIVNTLTNLPVCIHELILSYACWMPHLILSEAIDFTVTRYTLAHAVALQLGAVYNGHSINTDLWMRLCQHYDPRLYTHVQTTPVDLNKVFNSCIAVLLNQGINIPTSRDTFTIYMFLTRHSPQTLLDHNFARLVYEPEYIEFLLERGAVLLWTHLNALTELDVPVSLYTLIEQYPPIITPHELKTITTMFERLIRTNPRLAHVLIRFRPRPRLRRDDILIFQMYRIRHGFGYIDASLIRIYIDLTKFVLQCNPEYATVVSEFIMTSSNLCLNELKWYAESINAKSVNAKSVYAKSISSRSCRIM